MTDQNPCAYYASPQLVRLFYTALLLPSSNSESGSLVSHERSILLMLFEVTLRSTRKTDMGDFSDGRVVIENARGEKVRFAQGIL